MNDDITSRIKAELSRIEGAEEVTILYACESGSRAWGFESRDSDYDVRFIYLKKTAWYLTIQHKRDVIEQPIDDELDVSGWDVPKALDLLRRSNPPLLEWIQSPIVYRKTPSFLDRMKALMGEYYSPVTAMHHYLKMAEKNSRKHLKGDQVSTKRFFYVLRPVLACRWIEQGHGVVPMEFARLLKVVDDDALRAEIDGLLAAKKAGAECDKRPRNTLLSDFLECELGRLRADAQEPPTRCGPEALDKLFVEILKEVNGDGLG